MAGFCSSFIYQLKCVNKRQARAHLEMNTPGLGTVGHLRKRMSERTQAVGRVRGFGFCSGLDTLGSGKVGHLRKS